MGRHFLFMDQHIFTHELEQLLNKHSCENESNTPDFILAMYLLACLEAYNKTVKRRVEWYGRMDEPGKATT